MRLILGDCIEQMALLPEQSIHACVTDPPYDLTSGKKGGSGQASLNLRSPAGRSRIGTGFMGMAWDGTGIAFNVETWHAVFRVLTPGAFLVAFGGPRTSHRMTCAIEDAGFEIRDCLSWLYGSGFPKSLNVGNGQGTALKPAWEPIVLARKPTIGTVGANIEKFGTGALNIDACRIDGKDGDGHGLGRWPANVCLDGEAARVLDEQVGDLVSGANPTRRGSDKFRGVYQPFVGQKVCEPARGAERGGPSRFYYTAKPSRAERERGTEHLDHHQRDDSRQVGNPGGDNPRNRGLQLRGNFHPTVKPVALMRWLVRLVTPMQGVVLDPFMGSGTTGLACVYEQRNFIGIEREAEYLLIAEHRIAAVTPLSVVALQI